MSLPKHRIEGIVTPVVTPLLPNGHLDYAAVERHQDFLLRRGISAIFVLGTTGEGPALPPLIRQEMIRASREATRSHAPLLVGISSASVEETLELARFAAAVGADGVVAAPPCYLPLETEELLSFYRILATEQPLPLYLYNMPSMTKITLLPELILRIAELPNVAGYKDSAGDFDAFQKVAAVLRERKDFSLFMGPDSLLGRAIAVGACGGVNSGSNVAPEFFTGMFEAARKQDQTAIDHWQKEIEGLQKIYQFRENICCGVAAGLKYALCGLGFCGKELTRPALPMEPNATIDAFIRHYTENYFNRATNS